jgi:hypothetical protein
VKYRVQPNGYWEKYEYASDEKGGREYTRAELEQKVRQWARGGSR